MRCGFPARDLLATRLVSTATLMSMVSNSHPHSIKRRLISAMAVLSTVGLFAGCSEAAANHDVTEQGRLAFGCTLAEHIDQEHGDPQSWSMYIGDNADPGVREIATVGNIFVAASTTGAVDRDHVGVQAQNLLESVSRIDTEMMGSGLEEIQTACADLDVGEYPDVSHEGQLDYACDLTAHLDQEYGSANQWSDALDGPVVNLALAAASLTGAYNGQRLAEAPELSEASRDLVHSINRVDAEMTDEAMAKFRSECEAR